MIAKCIGYKYKTFRNYCYFCGLSFTPNTRKYLINYGNKFQTDLVCSKNCRDQAIYLANYAWVSIHRDVRDCIDERGATWHPRTRIGDKQ
jgi:hypothetical protein